MQRAVYSMDILNIVEHGHISANVVDLVCDGPNTAYTIRLHQDEPRHS